MEISWPGCSSGSEKHDLPSMLFHSWKFRCVGRLLIITTRWQCFSIWRRRTTPLGVMEFYLVDKKLGFVVGSLYLFSSSYLIVFYEFGLVIFYLSLVYLRMLFHKGVFSVLCSFLWPSAVLLFSSLTMSIVPSMWMTPTCSSQLHGYCWLDWSYDY